MRIDGIAKLFSKPTTTNSQNPTQTTSIMKCIAAVVMVALVASAQAGSIYNAIPTVYNAIPSVYSVPATTVVQQNVAPKYVAAYSAPAISYANQVSAPVAYSTYSAPAAYAAPVAYAAQAAYAAPVAYAAQAAYAAPVAYAAQATYAVPQVYAQVQKEASYVAATRGAVHVAPLAGHAVNQKSLNVEPAPGTL